MYVRKSPKTHGTKEKVEGELPPAPEVVVIEDLISTGASVLNTVESLVKEKGARVLGVYAIFSYEIKKSQEGFAKLKLPVFTLFGFSNLLTTLRTTNQLNKTQEKLLRAWKQGLDEGKESY